MLKQVELYGQRFEFRSIDGGRTWSSDPRSLVEYRRRQERARTEVRRRFEEMQEELPSPDPGDVYEIALPKDSFESF